MQVLMVLMLGLLILNSCYCQMLISVGHHRKLVQMIKMLKLLQLVLLSGQALRHHLILSKHGHFLNLKETHQVSIH
jgi:hypothetical protein